MSLFIIRPLIRFPSLFQNFVVYFIFKNFYIWVEDELKTDYKSVSSYGFNHTVFIVSYPLYLFFDFYYNSNFATHFELYNKIKKYNVAF